MQLIVLSTWPIITEMYVCYGVDILYNSKGILNFNSHGEYSCVKMQILQLTK